MCMTPEESRYFANPGSEDRDENGCFNRKFVFTWGDENNQPINEWHRVAERLLSIPMAHKMIAFYTVADAGDSDRLKVLRSYQYMAVDAITKKLEAARGIWGLRRPEGGFVWHTTDRERRSPLSRQRSSPLAQNSSTNRYFSSTASSSATRLSASTAALRPARDRQRHRRFRRAAFALAR